MDDKNLPEHAYDRPDHTYRPWPGSPAARSYFADYDYNDDEDNDDEDGTDD